ncbi:L,D-transpeptidase family protein [Streptomyces sirii]|uniref:L,D-transpeptidase family protein n=1 Tax=Streptomyces sirii TaxID=3127701 RepID=UPI003D367A79
MKRTLVALLACASLPALAGSPAAAVAPSPAAHAASGLLPGASYAPQRAERHHTPDPVRAAQAPDAPVEEPLHLEDVPRSETERGARAASCSGSTGPFQRQAERYLRRAVDGLQSEADCRAIRRFQRAHRIAPASGFAGPVTGAMLRLMRAQKDPNRDGHCPERRERTVCVDLDRQLLWVQQGRRVVFEPVAIRSGQPTNETRTGTYRIYLRKRAHTSNLYHTPMPFAQFFDRGEALHGVYDDIYQGLGSHGCVNLGWRDASRLWGALRHGDVVHVWGRRPSG